MKKTLISLAAITALAMVSHAQAQTLPNRSGMSMQAAMSVDFAAFKAKAAAFSAYEKRDEPSLKTVAESLDKIATTFEEYKKTNDARLEALKEGKSTADFDAKLSKMDEHMTSLSEAKSRLEKLEAKLARPGIIHDSIKDAKSKEEVEHRNAFVNWVRDPQNEETKAALAIAQKANQEKRQLELKLQGVPERRAAQVVTSIGGAGGFALPEVIERTIARLSVDISPIRQLATVRPVGSPDYKELFDANGATFEWLGETDPRSQTNTPDLREVVPTFGMASAKPHASEESLDDLFFNVEQWLIDSASEALGQGEGAAFISGNGVKKPTGILAGPAPVATNDLTRAFGTLQYIASGQAAAMPASLDVLYDMVYAVRARYRANAKWLTSKLVLSALRKYKDGQGQYLWQPSVVAGQPDLFMGYGITEAEDMPVVAANSFPLAFGDFKEGYLIVDRVGMRMTRDEITSPGFVKFYVRKRVGGCLRNTQAIKLLKIATA
jgi:HK97 family phage major capsid protein